MYVCMYVCVRSSADLHCLNSAPSLTNLRWWSPSRSTLLRDSMLIITSMIFCRFSLARIASLLSRFTSQMRLSAASTCSRCSWSSGVNFRSCSSSSR